MFFRVGDKVICIDDKPRKDIPRHLVARNFVKKGVVYTLREIVASTKGNGMGFLLEEVRNEPLYYPVIDVCIEPVFKSERFVKFDYLTGEKELVKVSEEEI
jgi:hypothetical protein